jgi:hypothetical protein
LVRLSTVMILIASTVGLRSHRGQRNVPNIVGERMGFVYLFVPLLHRSFCACNPSNRGVLGEETGKEAASA